jgi:hypothetical protein
MLLATINSSIILIALDIFRRIHLDPLTPANTNYLLRTTACLLVGWASVLTSELTEAKLADPNGAFMEPSGRNQWQPVANATAAKTPKSSQTRCHELRPVAPEP